MNIRFTDKLVYISCNDRTTVLCTRWEFDHIRLDRLEQLVKMYAKQLGVAI